MGYQPIARTVPQYMDGNGDPYSGAVLKAYKAGTSTAISMATDATGATLVPGIVLNASGYPAVSGNVIIPYLNQAYKLALYPNQSAADSNTGAKWNPDNLSVGLSFGEKTVEISSNTTLTQAEHANAHINISGTTILTLPPITAVANAMIFTYRNTGTESIVFDGDGADQINGAAVVEVKPGASGIVIAGDTYWSATGVSDLQAVDGVPVGTILPFGGSVEPPSYVFGWGQAISRTDFAALFAVYGTTYGVGDEALTFNLPDLRGRSISGLDDMGGVAASRLTLSRPEGVDGSVLGATGGAEDHQLIIAEQAIHNHEQNRAYRSDYDATGGIGVNFVGGNNSGNFTEDSGGDEAHNNMPPTLVANYIIKF